MSWATVQAAKLGAVLIAALAVMLLGVYVAPLFVSQAEQDECSFGPVSNAQYRALLAEAKRRQRSEWPALVWDNRKAGDLLNARFDELSSGMTSVYERLAVMHAVVRALGGDYRNTSSDYGEEPYRNVLERGAISMHYHIDVNKLGFFSPFGRQMWLAVIIVGPNYRPAYRSEPRAKRGDIRFTVHFPNIIEGYYDIPKSRFGERCSPIPDSEAAPRFAP